MKFRSLRVKIIFWIGICLFITAGTVIAYSVFTMKQRAESDRDRLIQEARKDACLIAKEHAGNIKAKLETALDAARILSQLLSGIKKDPSGICPDRDEIVRILKIILSENPDFAGVYTCWEPDAFDGKDESFKNSQGHDESGRFVPYWGRDKNGAAVLSPLPNYEKEEYYLIPGKTKTESLIDPRMGRGDKGLVISAAVPIMVGETFYGIAGIDLKTDILQGMLDGFSGLYNNSEQIFLISNNGTVAAAGRKPDMAGKSLKTIDEENFEQKLRHIQSGKETVLVTENRIECFAPLKAGRTEIPWSLNVILNKEKISAAAEEQMRLDLHEVWKIAGTGLLCMLVAFVILWYIAESISRPIRRTCYALKDIAKGDLTKRMEVKAENELGELAKWLNTFLNNFQRIIKDIAEDIETLNTSSWDLSDISGKMKKGTDEINSKSENVASATEEMSMNINTMATAAEEMSVNIQSVSFTAEQMARSMNSVASAIEEMSVAIADISRRSTEGARTSEKAMLMAKTATLTMNNLGDTAMEIDEVTEVIKKIAEQTNLLALNATIEAASAGDAGKGFAVVAKEIKELAGQSSHSAENIAKRIKDVQKNTVEAVKVIDEVSEIINKINESSMAMMRAIEQQTETSNDISANIQEINTGAANIASSIAEVAKGSNDMSRNAGEAAGAATDVASNIQGISHAAGEANSGAKQVNRSAEELAKVARKLQEMVGQFKTV
ncbi:MAG: hypothetical protein BWK80_16935 [Desulfobacteraceae bacterium IS3]|nr:MAG: hypothetical protein BWK80_16935 [Desulfobacteraceae bacterium IS3]